MPVKHQATKLTTGIDSRFLPPLPYIIHRKSIKHVYFRFKGDTLHISQPRRILETQLLSLLWQKKDAIEVLRSREATRPQYVLADGEEWILISQSYRLQAGPQFKLSEGRIDYPPKMTSVDVQRRLAMKLLVPIVQEFITYYWPRIDSNRAAPSITYRTMNRLYGAYYPREHRIQFNNRLIFRTLDEIRYVVIHELMHARIDNHSDAFYQAIEQILPDYRRHHDLLKHSFIADTHSKS